LQIRTLIGRFFIDESIAPATLGTAEANQIQALYQAGVNYAVSSKKLPGSTLTAADLSSISTNLIWPEKRNIGGVDMYVPVVYLTQATVDSRTLKGNLIEFGGNTTYASILLDGVTLTAGRDIFVKAIGDIKNNGGKIQGTGNLELSSGGTLANLSGQVTTAGNLKVFAKNVLNKTLVIPFKDKNGQGTRLGPVASINADGSLEVTADNDITYTGATSTSGGTITLTSHGNITLEPVATQTESQTQEGHWRVNQSTLDLLQSKLTAEDTISLVADGQIKITASELLTKGGIELLAGQGIYVLDDLSQTQIQKVDRKGKTTGQSSEFRTEAVRAVLRSGKAVLLDSEFGDVTLKAAEITSADGAQVNALNGHVRLLMTKELEDFHLQTVRKGTWTIKTHQEDITNENNIPNAIVGGLDVKAKYAIEVEYTGKNGATVTQQIEEFRKSPELKWMADLYDKSNTATGPKVDWQQVDEIHKELKKTTKSLSPAAMAIIAIAVAVCTGGAGTGFVDAVMHAAMTTLETQALSSLAAGNSPAATIKMMSSNESLRNLAVSMVTAGALQATQLKMFEVAADAPVNAATIASQAGQALVNATVEAGISVAINGGSMSDFTSQFRQSLITDAINTLGQSISDKITNSKNLADAERYISHAVLGCFTASLTNKLTNQDYKDACPSGAAGAVISDVVSSVEADSLESDITTWIRDNAEDNTKNTYKNADSKLKQLRQRGINIAKLVAAVSLFALGGDVNAGANAANMTARSNLSKFVNLAHIYLEVMGKKDFGKPDFISHQSARGKEVATSKLEETPELSASERQAIIQLMDDEGVFEHYAQLQGFYWNNGERITGAANGGTLSDNGGIDEFLVTANYWSSLGDFARSVDRVRKSLTPAKQMALSWAIGALTTGAISSFVQIGKNYAISRLIPKEIAETLDGYSAAAETAMGSGVLAVYAYMAEDADADAEATIEQGLLAQFDHIKGSYQGIKARLDDPDETRLQETVSGFGYLAGSVLGIAGQKIVQQTSPIILDKINSNPKWAVNTRRSGATPLKDFKTVKMGDLYAQAKQHPIGYSYFVDVMHLDKNGNVPRRNDGQIGEDVTRKMMKDITGKDVTPLQNSSNQGSDGFYFDHDSKTIYLVEVKSSINGVDSAKPPSTTVSDKLIQWDGDFKKNIYVQDPTLQSLLKEYNNARLDGYQVKGLWVQIEVPPLGGSSNGKLEMLVSIF
jgi:adhesin HecA-like repeat protein